MDRDNDELGLHLKFKAFDAVLNVYQFGSHSSYTMQSLVLGIGSATDIVYDLFNQHNLAPSLVDEYIVSAFKRTTPFDTASVEQVQLMVTSMLSYVVAFQISLSSFQNSVAECEAGNMDNAIQFWEIGADAFLGSQEQSDKSIGSVEGGYLIFSMATDNCDEFLTCNTNPETQIKSAESNKAMLVGLVNGKDAMTGSPVNCKQQEANYRRGWMLYAVTQSVSEIFGLVEGEAVVNTQLMKFFNDAKKITKRCSSSTDSLGRRHRRRQGDLDDNVSAVFACFCWVMRIRAW